MAPGPEVRQFATAKAAADACGAHILDLLRQALTERGTGSLAISGGSTPKLMFESMVRTGFDWINVHVFWVDERSVPPDHAQSNFRMAKEALLDPGNVPNAHRIQAELPPDHAAAAYAEDLRRHFGLAEGKLPAFDIVHLGIGSDAHTASLFPGEPAIEDRQGLAAAVYVEKIPQWRITLLPGVLLAARNVVVLTAGHDKKEALHNILYAPYAPMDFPAQAIVRNQPRCTLYVDNAAFD